MVLKYKRNRKKWELIVLIDKNKNNNTLDTYLTARVKSMFYFHLQIFKFLGS